MSSQVRAIGFLTAVLVVTGSGIFSVHSMQKEERANLHQGVIRDQALMALKEQQRREHEAKTSLLSVQR
uniref:Uncharacterized protein n=1 Tax=Physcomitrium patens TaxID=3218 RepID=A0A2K1L0B4_PHYPA|nr:hypothetical protein PHYPA_002255 [Physcomitrium patens]